MKNKVDTKKLVTIAVFSALAYVISFFSFPIAGFLSFELKDCVITVIGFMYGPLSALACTAISAFAEMFTYSKTGLIGCAMNIVSSASFACTAAFIYKKRHNLKGAVNALAVSCVVSTVIMLAWNYILTPLYTGAPRAAVVSMMLPILLPFNLAKSVVNASVTVLIYKPMVKVLRKTNLVKPSESNKKYKMNWGLIAVVCFLVITGVSVLYLINANNTSSNKSQDASTDQISEETVVNENVDEKTTVYDTITQEKAKEYIDDEEPVIILDVRTYEEHDAGHIENSLCIPVDNIKEKNKAQIEMMFVSKEQTILVFGDSNGNSKVAAENLAKMGYTGVKDCGDIKNWKHGMIK